MFGKLFVLILGAGAIALTLLVIRQQRIDAVHEMARIHRRLLQHEQACWKLDHQIATQCRPDRVREYLKLMDAEWSPLPSKAAAGVPKMLSSSPGNDELPETLDVAPGQ